MAAITSVKVGSLRSQTNPLTKKKYLDFKDWLTVPDNEYTGRNGRIFVKRGDASKIFHYKKSKWENPFTVKEHGLEKALSLYVEHLYKSIKKDGVRHRLIYDIFELEKKTLGCFCDPQKKIINKKGIPICHAQILYDLLHRCRKTLLKSIEQCKEIDNKK